MPAGAAANASFDEAAASTCLPKSASPIARPMAASTDAECTGRNRGRALGWPPAAVSPSRASGCPDTRVDGLPKRAGCLLSIALMKPQRPDRVPRVRTAFATVEMSTVFKRELTLESFECCCTFVTREMNQASQPVKGNGAESRLSPPAVQPDRRCPSPAHARLRRVPAVRREQWRSSQCANANPGSSASVRCAARRRSSPHPI